MKQLTLPITLDREFLGAMIALTDQIKAPKPLPIVINGLSGGATDAFLTESVRAGMRAGAPVSLLLARDEADAIRVAAALAEDGLSVAVYPSRELCFFEMSASHDVERERLLVLHKLMLGELDAVVATAYAAMQPTLLP